MDFKESLKNKNITPTTTAAIKSTAYNKRTVL